MHLSLSPFQVDLTEMFYFTHGQSLQKKEPSSLLHDDGIFPIYSSIPPPTFIFYKAFYAMCVYLFIYPVERAKKSDMCSKCSSFTQRLHIAIWVVNGSLT